MEETGAENFPSQRIIHRKNRANVGAKRPSGVFQIARKVVPVVLTAASLAGAGKAMTSNVNAESGDDGAKVTFVTRPSEESEPQKIQDGQELFDTVFHDLDTNQELQVRQEVDMFKSRILAKVGYEHEHMEIPLRYQDVIEQTATAYGISVDTLMGLIGTENGGGTDKISSISKARGVAQFMPETAKQYKLMDDKIDHRGDPVLSIDAAGRYLRDTKSLFAGDEGMALWSYHAGPGNVYHALRIYFYDVNHENLNDYGAAITNNNAFDREYIEKRTKELIIQDKLDISKLLANPKVKEFTATLKDYSETYPATVVAMSQIIKEYEMQHPIHDIGGGLKVALADKPGSPLSK